MKSGGEMIKKIAIMLSVATLMIFSFVDTKEALGEKYNYSVVTYDKELKVSVTDDENGISSNQSSIVDDKPISSNSKPEIHLEDKIVSQNEKFNILSGITAIDKEDGDITDNIDIKITNFINSIPGEYKVVYIVSDSDGNTVEKERKITVVSK